MLVLWGFFWAMDGGPEAQAYQRGRPEAQGPTVRAGSPGQARERPKDGLERSRLL